MNELDLCDKCGQSVSPDNDALNLSVRVGESTSFAILFSQRRHLRPTGECPGSPSRWRRVLAGEALWKEHYDAMQS